MSTKTPEQLAEKYRRFNSAFVANFEAAQDQLAAYEAAKPKWISVKERLPEEGQRVLLYNSLEYVSIVMAHWYSSPQTPFFNHVTIDDIHINFPLKDNKHLYWMPLPEAPKE